MAVVPRHVGLGAFRARVGFDHPGPLPGTSVTSGRSCSLPGQRAWNGGASPVSVRGDCPFLVATWPDQGDEYADI